MTRLIELIILIIMVPVWLVLLTLYFVCAGIVLVFILLMNAFDDLKRWIQSGVGK